MNVIKFLCVSNGVLLLFAMQLIIMGDIPCSFNNNIMIVPNNYNNYNLDICNTTDVDCIIKYLYY